MTDTTYKDLAKLILQSRPGRTLDVPAGKGDLSRELLAGGVSDLTCIDILPEAGFPLAGKVRYSCTDINGPLPFADGEFECVASREGIEHLVTPYAFLGELCRVLKPGGHLFITTPNIMTVDARMKYLLSGYFQGFRELCADQSGLRDLEFQGHISPIYFWQLAYFLANYGLVIEKVTTNRITSEAKPIKRMVRRLLAGVIRATARRRGFPAGETLSDDFLFGDSLIVQARRVGDRLTRHGNIF